MASALVFSPILILILLPSLSHQSPITAADKDLIQQTCRGTKHPELCITTIKADRSSNTESIHALALLMARRAEANADSTSSFLSDSGLKNGTTPAYQSLLRLCASKYGYASEALQASVKYLASNKYYYAGMEVSTAMKYPRACGCAFRAAGIDYPPMLIRREEAVEQLSDIALAIIKLLVREK